MDYVIPAFLGLILGLLAYVAFWRKPDAAPAADPATATLLEETQRQLAAAKAEAAQERAIKEAALQKAAAAEATRITAQAQQTEGAQAHERALNHLREEHRQATADAKAAATQALEQLRADQQKALAEAESRYDRALAEMRTTFEKTSTDVLKGMAPDVTKEVATKVEPLISQVNAALENYRKAMQQGLSTQDQSLTQVKEQMARITETTTALATSTNDFTSVLKSAQHRGKWGEQTLRNVVEAARLSPHCDFAEQVSQDDARPDLIVKLPGNRCVIIDSKVPEFDVAIADQAAPNRRELVAAHAAKLRKTIRDLAAKDYPATLLKQGVQPFDKVVLFLPAESLLSTALEGDNDLILAAGREGILIATPATLIGFLGAINLTWQQHVQAENAGRIAAEATELYDRLLKFAEHFNKVRKGLVTAAEGLDAAIGSFETRIRPQGERVRELGGAASRDALTEISPVNARIRQADGPPA